MGIRVLEGIGERKREMSMGTFAFFGFWREVFFFACVFPAVGRGFNTEKRREGEKRRIEMNGLYVIRVRM